MSDQPKNRKAKLVALLGSIADQAKKADNIAALLDDDYPDEVWSHAAEEAVKGLDLWVNFDSEDGQLYAGIWDDLGGERIENLSLEEIVRKFNQDHDPTEHREAYRNIRANLEAALAAMPPKD